MDRFQRTRNRCRISKFLLAPVLFHFLLDLSYLRGLGRLLKTWLMKSVMRLHLLYEQLAFVNPLVFEPFGENFGKLLSKSF